jgi:glutaredoxin
MKTVKVSGKNKKHRVILYTLSTCAWCKMLKEFLKKNDIEYEYIDVDDASEKTREGIMKDIRDRGGRIAYPTIIIDNRILICGFLEDKLREALEI